MKKRRKRPITLIEIMIVIFLIGLIGGVLAFNFKGSLDEGKVFKTEQGIEQIHNVLMLAAASGGKSLEEVTQNWQVYLKESPLVAKPEALARDGWGELYTVITNDERSDILISSKNLEKHQKKH